MQLKLLNGYPDYIGKRLAIVGSGTGPSSYVQIGANNAGDVITFARYGNYIDSLSPAVTVSGTYIVYPIPSGVGARQVWRAKWVVAATGAEVAAAVDLSAQSVQLGGFGGVY